MVFCAIPTANDVLCKKTTNMKKLTLSIIAIIVITLNLHADPIIIPTTVDPSNETTERGHRMPPAPVMAVVDIEAGTVSGTSPLLDGIVSYQIWEADGSLCIADASDPATAFRAVDGLHGTYMLRMRGDGYTLTGHIDL